MMNSERSHAIIARGITKQFRIHKAVGPRTIRGMFFGGGWHRRPDRSKVVLREISFQCPRGEMLAIIGRNGCGKSTLLRLLAGLGEPQSGSITRNGRLGAILQLSSGFHGDLTGRENALLNGIMSGLSRSQVESQLDQIFNFAELPDYADAPFRTYSSGMQMRLAFAAVLYSHPDILLIDEVLAVGDLAFQQKCLAAIRSLKSHGKSIIFVSHNLNQVQSLADQCLWLQEGQVAAMGAPKEVIEQYKGSILDETIRRKRPESAETPTHVGPSPSPATSTRLGTQEVEIREVTLHTSTGILSKELPAGTGLQIRIDFHAPRPVTAAIFGLTVKTAGGMVCIGASTDNSECTVGPLHGRGRIMAYFPQLHLAPGTYHMEVGCYEATWKYVYDYCNRAASFTVLGKHAHGGSYVPPLEWHMQNL